ncbi:hypothetical protein Lfu02_20020 [Longispora fulva]|uniref:Mannitol-specific phosphotransferase system IIBC component n=1 Tax=Longispora fulva TaxID=619741 RepID=A0A8J7GKS3_9ACTN|nr:DUF4229 domain-containing protein [Longispora fulva]MBG6139991.1 mannitol-specific phosphotransferase system IIBC component [Longispora fulva]GIG57630.1 hypothetical protein Lfu02_20020 [Longispora fulva]
MSPFVKYTLARLGMFAAIMVVLVLLPLPITLVVKVMVALLISLVLSFFLLKKMRDEMSDYIAGSVQRRQAEKDKLRAALAGEDEDTPPAGKPATPADPSAEKPTDGPQTV